MINGAILRQLRKSARLTQTQLAKKLGNGGYTKFVIAAIENDKRNIGLSLLADWASACGYDVQISFSKSGEVIEDEVSEVELPNNFDGELL